MVDLFSVRGPGDGDEGNAEEDQEEPEEANALCVSGCGWPSNPPAHPRARVEWTAALQRTLMPIQI